MSWVDSMRLRRKADIVRWIGWINLFLSIVVGLFHISEASAVTTLAGWALAVLALTYGIAWMLDRRAERVVGR